jgi:hypothetical protein
VCRDRTDTCRTRYRITGVHLRVEKKKKPFDSPKSERVFLPQPHVFRFLRTRKRTSVYFDKIRDPTAVLPQGISYACMCTRMGARVSATTGTAVYNPGGAEGRRAARVRTSIADGGGCVYRAQDRSFSRIFLFSLDERRTQYFRFPIPSLAQRAAYTVHVM